MVIFNVGDNMRMDRYEDENKSSDVKTTRLDKNQELYTDVYLNNVYVDINNLKDVMEDTEQEPLSTKSTYDYATSYNYEEKEYDINKIIDKALQNKVDDKLKRHLDIEDSNKEIQDLIASITDNSKSNEDNLLEDLMPTNDNTTVIPPLEEPILDTAPYEVVKDDDKEEETSGNIFDDVTNEYDKIKTDDMETDDSFVDKKGNSHLKIILILSILFIAIGIVVALKLLKVF